MILIAVGIVVAVVGFLLLTQPADQTGGTPTEHKAGAGETGVTLVEYGDFQCPGCAQYFPVMQQIKEHYGDQITFQFRHFPLESRHQNARAAARAAEAAAKQGKFWEMHDQLFMYQAQWETTNDPISTFESYASNIGIENMEQFKSDYRSAETNRSISADLKAGRDLGVSATPTFFLDGQKLEGTAASFEGFKQLIDAKIEEKTGQKPSSEQNNEGQKPEDNENQEQAPQENTTE